MHKGLLYMQQHDTMGTIKQSLDVSVWTSSMMPHLDIMTPPAGAPTMHRFFGPLISFQGPMAPPCTSGDSIARQCRFLSGCVNVCDYEYGLRWCTGGSGSKKRSQLSPADGRLPSCRHGRQIGTESMLQAIT